MESPLGFNFLIRSSLYSRYTLPRLSTEKSEMPPSIILSNGNVEPCCPKQLAAIVISIPMKKLFFILHPYDARFIFGEPGCQLKRFPVKYRVRIITYPVAQVDIPASILEFKIYGQVPVTKNE